MTLLYLSEAMVRNISKEHFVATNVLMAFEDGSVSFCIPEGATLADISESLDKVGKWHTGKLVSIDVRFKAPGESGFGCGPDHPLISSSVSNWPAHRIISQHSSIIQPGFIVFLMEFCGADRVRSNGV